MGKQAIKLFVNRRHTNGKVYETMFNITDKGNEYYNHGFGIIFNVARMIKFRKQKQK